MCDGNDDCGNNSDERQCGNSKFELSIQKNHISYIMTQDLQLTYRSTHKGGWVLVFIGICFDESISNIIS